MLVFMEGEKPEKNTRSKARTNKTQTHMRRRVRESNPGYRSGRRAGNHCTTRGPPPLALPPPTPVLPTTLYEQLYNKLLNSLFKIEKRPLSIWIAHYSLTDSCHFFFLAWMGNGIVLPVPVILVKVRLFEVQPIAHTHSAYSDTVFA